MSPPDFSDERYDRKVQEYYDLQIQFIALPDERYAVVCHFADISERMRLTNELRQYTAVLSESDRRKNEFLELLPMNPETPSPRSAVLWNHAAQDGGQRYTGSSGCRYDVEPHIGQMVRLVDDLLDVGRISRGKIELRVGRVELASAVHHAGRRRPCVPHVQSLPCKPRPTAICKKPARLDRSA